ncbi:MAG TPA: hypothetical protein VFA68_14885 [Terriglobales bacterium]|nr:hypothetical protein [Terriglobales bacterium]
MKGLPARLSCAVVTFFLALFLVLGGFASGNGGSPQDASSVRSGILYADQFRGSDDGERISKALAACAQQANCIVDARSLTQRAASAPIVIAQSNVTLLMPAGEFTLAGSPGILIEGHGVNLIGVSRASAPAPVTQSVLQTSSATADIVQVRGTFDRVTDFTLRSTVKRQQGAGLNVMAGNGYFDNLRIEKTWDGIDLRSPAAAGHFSHITMGQGYSKSGNWNAGIYIGGIAKGGVSNATFQDVLITADAPFATAQIVLDDGTDTPLFSNCAAIASNGISATSVLFQHTAGGMLANDALFVNCIFAGGRNPAIDFEGFRNAHFKNIVIDPGLRGILQNFAGGYAEFDGGYIQQQQREAVLMAAGPASIRNMRIGDNSQAAHDRFDDIKVGAGVSDFALVGNIFSDVQGLSPANRPRHNIEIVSGPSDRYSVMDNNFSPELSEPLLDLGTGTNKISVNRNAGSMYVPRGMSSDASGYKHRRFPAPLGGSCPSAAAAGAACTSAGLNWGTPFPDNDYTVSCTLTTPSGQPHISSYSKLPGGRGIRLTIAADTAAAADAGADCIAVHD